MTDVVKHIVSVNMVGDSMMHGQTVTHEVYLCSSQMISHSSVSLYGPK